MLEDWCVPLLESSFEQLLLQHAQSLGRVLISNTAAKTKHSLLSSYSVPYLYFFFPVEPEAAVIQVIKTILGFMSSCETLPVSLGHLESQSHAVVISSDPALLV